VLPLSGDFFIYGGLYRGVSLVEADSASIDLLDHGGPGVYARTDSVTNGEARLLVHTRLRNQSPRVRKLSLVLSILDADGKTVATAMSPATLYKDSLGELDQLLSVPAAHLWNGRADPYLYRIVAELREGARIVDSITQPLGIRIFRVDPDKGFFLNGQHLALHGVARHQDLMGKGWAMTAEDQAADMAMIKELGANTIRMAHYEHAQAWAEEADKAGMVAWAEIPFVTASSLEGKLPSDALTANAREQLTELIRQDYNHPSIAMWSVGNEINAGELFMPGNKPQQSLPLLQNLAALAKQEDQSRPTTFADCCEDSTAFEVHGPALAGTTDLIGYNRYFGWYYGQPADFGATLDSLHAKHPTLPMSVSEYGAGGGLSQHTDNPEGGQIAIVGRPHPEEYESWYHERSWQQIQARPWLFASWVWSMFDFASDFRGEGDSVDLNDKGLVTFDRKTKKDAFYFYQAQWSAEPMLHLNGRRYVDRAYPVTDVRAYSNAPSVSLHVNGVRVGDVVCPDHICVWKDVSLKPGDNLVEASATLDGRQLTDQLHWTAPDIANGIHIESGELNGRMSGSVRYGSDAFFVGGAPTLLNPLVLRAGFNGPKGKQVTGEGDLALHHAYRAGSFAYDVPLPDGTWTVTLHTTEPDPALAATRSFDVRANGKTILSAFSPAKIGGAPLIAVAKTFKVKSIHGRLKLEFIARGGPAIVSALDISKGEGAK
jgi:beta-galactosidase